MLQGLADPEKLECISKSNSNIHDFFAPTHPSLGEREGERKHATAPRLSDAIRDIFGIIYRIGTKPCVSEFTVSEQSVICNDILN